MSLCCVEISLPKTLSVKIFSEDECRGYFLRLLFPKITVVQYLFIICGVKGVVSQKRNEPREVKNILDGTFSLIVLGFHKLF